MNSNFYQQTKGEVFISTDPSLIQVDVVHQYLTTESYWAEKIPKATVEKAILNSLCFGVYQQHQLIGFARVMTDKATFAYVADVFILKSYQGKGYGKWLMEVIHAHPELQGLRRWLLTTKDAHGLYEQFGWQPISDDLRNRLMTINKPNIYKDNL
ncbi:MAG: GNAT family N-acetyltransferase [Chitinophagaceae bacterium]|nr:GNAT family N-acetyltransferase [Chitinophagaceae bacterium]